MILVDTNVLSELTRPTPEPRVIAWLEVNEPALALPTIALAELRYGIARLPDGAVGRPGKAERLFRPGQSRERRRMRGGENLPVIYRGQRIVDGIERQRVNAVFRLLNQSTISASRRDNHIAKCGHSRRIASRPISSAARMPNSGFW